MAVFDSRRCCIYRGAAAATAAPENNTKSMNAIGVMHPLIHHQQKLQQPVRFPHPSPVKLVVDSPQTQWGPHYRDGDAYYWWHFSRRIHGLADCWFVATVLKSSGGLVGGGRSNRIALKCNEYGIATLREGEESANSISLDCSSNGLLKLN